MKYKDIPISDSHIHIFWNMLLEKKEALLKELIEKFNYDTVTILSIPFSAARLSKCRDFLENLGTFYFKCIMPEKVYGFAGFSPSYDEKNNTAEFFLKQAEFYMAAGFDGIKMIEGRPNQRHICGGFDDEKYQLFYKYAEENQIPIVMHANGSEISWREGGKMYGKHPDWLELYEEMERVMEKYPELRVTIAHFFFASERIELASSFLDRWENVYYDLCPNQFMYLDFQKNPKEWTAFFEKYQDRLIYGTDIGSNTKDIEGTEAESLVHMVRGFFEETEHFSELGYDFSPMPLNESILRKIYKENMMSFYQNKKPNKPNTSVMKKELDFIKGLRVFLDLNDMKNLELIETVF